MTAQIFSIFGPAADLVSRVLVHSLWQGGLIALTFGLILLFVRHSNARLRYALSWLAMVMMIALSVVTAVSIGGGYRPVNTATAAPETAQPFIGPAYEGVTSLDAGSSNGARVSSIGQIITPASLVSWVFPIWMLGVLALSLYHLVGWRKARKLIRHGIAEVPPEWAGRFKRLCHELKIDRAIRLAASSLVRVPCVVGWLKPVVLVPLSSFTGLEAKELELILLHELAHIRRCDVLVSYAQTVAEILFFFNPAVWWISRQIRIERENCCDDTAVACCGDRVRYARALTNLEELRTVSTSFAAAADGTPLSGRVRRLLGLSAPRSQSHNMGVAGIFLLTALLALSFSSISGTLSSDVSAATKVETSGSFEPDRNDIEGEWDIEFERRYAQVRMSFGRNWQTGFTIRTNKLLKEIDATTTYFKLIRDAGTFHFDREFEGSDDDLWGEGRCYFRANPDFVKEMEKRGYDLDDEDDVLTLALHDLTFDFARGLDELGYDDLSLSELINANIHDVTPEFIRELDELGYRRLKMSKLVEMRIHDADPDFIHELAELGYDDLSVDELVEMRIHDVTPDVIHDLAEQGYDDLSVGELVEMQIHDVDPDFIADLAELGYKNLRRSTLVKMQIHDVSPSYIRKLADLGYEDLSPSKLVEMKIHDVSPRFIRELAKLGYDDLSPSMLVQLQIHDVTPSFVRRMHARGMDNFSAEELVEYKILH